MRSKELRFLHLVLLCSIIANFAASEPVKFDDITQSSSLFGNAGAQTSGTKKVRKPTSSLDNVEDSEEPFVRRGYGHGLENLDLNEMPAAEPSEPAYVHNPPQGYESVPPYGMVQNDAQLQASQPASYQQNVFPPPFGWQVMTHPQNSETYGYASTHHPPGWGMSYAHNQDSYIPQRPHDPFSFHGFAPALDHADNPVQYQPRYWTTQQEQIEYGHGYQGGSTTSESAQQSSSSAIASSRSSQDSWQQLRLHPDQQYQEQQHLIHPVNQFAYPLIHRQPETAAGTGAYYQAGSSSGHRPGKEPAKPRKKRRRQFEEYYRRDPDPRVNLVAEIRYSQVPYEYRQAYVNAKRVPQWIIDERELRGTASFIGRANRALRETGLETLPSLRKSGFDYTGRYRPIRLEGESEEDFLARSEGLTGENVMVPKILITRPDQIPAEAEKLIEDMTNPKDRIEKLKYVYQVTGVEIPNENYLRRQSNNLYDRWNRKQRQGHKKVQDQYQEEGSSHQSTD